jgi:hypothetical protein
VRCSDAELFLLYLHCHLQQATYAALQLETVTAAATNAAATTSRSCCTAAVQLGAATVEHNVIETDVSKQRDAPHDDVATDVTLQSNCESELLVMSVS